PLPQSYRIAPQTPALDKEILEENHLTTIDCTTSELVASASAELGDIHIDPKNIDDLRQNIPADLRAAFDLNVALMTSLLSAWEYVNQADFASADNIHEFLRGDKPNWSCVGNQKPFKRDVETAVSDALLDYATDTKGRRKNFLVLGSAGYGTTTV